MWGFEMNISAERMAHIRRMIDFGTTLTTAEVEDLQCHNDHLTGLCEAQARIILRNDEDAKFIRENWFYFDACTKTLRSNVNIFCDGFEDGIVRAKRQKQLQDARNKK